MLGSITDCSVNLCNTPMAKPSGLSITSKCQCLQECTGDIWSMTASGTCITFRSLTQEQSLNLRYKQTNQGMFTWCIRTQDSNSCIFAWRIPCFLNIKSRLFKKTASNQAGEILLEGNKYVRAGRSGCKLQQRGLVGPRRPARRLDTAQESQCLRAYLKEYIEQRNDYLYVLFHSFTSGRQETAMSTEMKKLNVLMCGTGEYTTGWTGAGASKSDKKIGVVGLTLFDLRRLGKVDKLGMVGTNGGKFPAIRQHLHENIANVYKDMDITFDAFPNGNLVDPEAYKDAINKLSPGDAVVIFTPDTTHFPIALYAIERGIHVLVTKPAVQLLAHHNELVAAAKKHNVVCFVEHHKRFDPVYSDAKARAATLGEFNFFSAWMSQPKSQLETFRAWAGKDSDISYYLSSHHIDIHCWIMQDKAVPTRVVASAATGIATGEPYNCVPQTEDTITLLVDWESLSSAKHRGTAVYTASWTAPLKSGVHSAQHWYYMAEKGEINVDQAHRGYDIVNDETGKAWYNPFYMKYSPSESGHFDGQRGYGYVSIEKFIDAARSVNARLTKPGEYDGHGLPTIANTVVTTAILNAGRISLDEKRPVFIKRSSGEWILE